MKRIIYLLSILLIGVILTGCSAADLFADFNESAPEPANANTEQLIEEDGYYTSKDEVALYIHTFNKLPDNYITKSEASKLGWVASEGNLWEVTDQKSIGGDRFGNREGSLPDKASRQYYEADIDYEGGYRGPKRIVYSNDGFIYYTDDHYDTFTLLYGDE